MFGRKPSRTHRQLAAHELAESYGHLKQAAGHAAGGAAAKFSPSYGRARGMAFRGLRKGMTTTAGTFVPLYMQMRDGANMARGKMMPHKKRNRGPMVLGLLAAGVAAGATGAVVARKRRAARQWDEYETLGDLETGRERAGQEKMSAAKSKVSHGMASMADTVAGQAGKVADTLRSSSPERSVAESAGKAAEKATGTAAHAADQMAEKSESASRNMRNM